MSHHLVMLDRERASRAASPTAAVIDSQSVKTTEPGDRAATMQAGKCAGVKRLAMVDPGLRPLFLQLHPTSVQDRDSAIPLLRASRPRLPFMSLAFADSGYQAEHVRNTTTIAVQIVRKHPSHKGFAVQSRRWVVEGCLAWLGRSRRLAKDFEATVQSTTAFLYAASAMLMIRRMARCT